MLFAAVLLLILLFLKGSQDEGGDERAEKASDHWSGYV